MPNSYLDEERIDYKKFRDNLNGEITVTLSLDERKFIQACYMDSLNEGHFDPGFDDIDMETAENGLKTKGLICFGN